MNRPEAADPQNHHHPERERDLEQPEQLQTQPYTPYTTYIDDFGNRCTRLVAPAGVLQLSSLAQVRDSGVQESLPWGAPQTLVNQACADIAAGRAGSGSTDERR